MAVVEEAAESRSGASAPSFSADAKPNWISPNPVCMYSVFTTLQAACNIAASTDRHGGRMPRATSYHAFDADGVGDGFAACDSAP